jgi:hypothetical protein
MVLSRAIRALPAMLQAIKSNNSAEHYHFKGPPLLAASFISNRARDVAQH